MKLSSIFCLLALLLSACIGDDIVFDTVDEAVRIISRVDTLGVSDHYPFEAQYTNRVGQTATASISWNSSDPAILSIDQTGLATGVALGTARVSATVERSGQAALSDTVLVVVDSETGSPTNNVRQGSIKTTSSYQLEGDFTLREENGKLILEFDSNYKASSSLPGLYVYLTNNENSTNNAFEIGEVKVFSGAHDYEIDGPTLNEYKYLLYYCKPFRVKVGDGEISD